jgi:hypothetical protein
VHYHGTGLTGPNFPTGEITFAVIPDFHNCTAANPGETEPLCLPPGDTSDLDAITYNASRQLMNVITDPSFTDTFVVPTTGGWANYEDDNGAVEIGDLCGFSTTTLPSLLPGEGPFVVQPGWSDAQGKCIPYPTVQPAAAPALPLAWVGLLSSMLGFVGVCAMRRRQ